MLRRWTWWTLGAMVMAASQSCAALKPQVIKTRWATGDVVIASQVVNPPADATTDAAPAIQAAIDQAKAAGGGVVFLSAGRYRLATPITVREGVILRGDWAPPGKARADQTTLLMLTSGRGNADAPPAIAIERGTGLRELTLWHPEQDAANPVPYPWAVALAKTATGDNSTVANVTLVNPWRGISIGPDWNELHTLRRIYATPLSLGIFIDTVTDIGRLDEVDLSPRWWTESGLPGAPQAGALAATLAKATGLDMGRSDWEYMYRLRVTGYGTGVVVRAGAQGTANAVMYGAELTDCDTALRLEGLNGVGLSVTASRLAGRRGLVTTDRFTTVAQFNSCRIEGIEHTGRGVLTLQHCDVSGPTVANQGTFSALDCDLGQVTIGAAVPRARLLGCRWQGQPEIDNKSQGDVAIVHRDLGLSRPNVAMHVPSPTPRPANDQLFDVTDSGAAATAEDNTAAFQKALDAAGAAGGGTVYVPAGRYRFRGHLTVPSGVELRGIWDVPHHTVSDGSTLMVTEGRGQEDGTPFISLQPNAGVRGLNVWHPEQDVAAPVPYPWVVRSLGVGCWAVDLNLGDAWQGVDFGTHPSDGHVVRYLSGCCLKRGLWVSRSATAGWVEDFMFNPHYALRLPPNMPHPPYAGDMGAKLIDWLRANLQGLALGRCAEEHVRGTFLYAAYDGIAFLDDQGGANARVIMHGSDTVSRSCYVEAGNIEGHLFQLVPLSAQAVAAWAVSPKFTGKARFDNSQIWAGNTTAVVEGTGDVLLSQMNTLTGPLRLAGGKARVIGAWFSGTWSPAVRIEPSCQSAEVVSCLSGAPLTVANGIGDKAYIRANAAAGQRAASGPATALAEDKFRASTGWEAGQPVGPKDTVATPGGGLKSVSGMTCGPVAGVGRDGGTALRLAGKADDPAYSFVYARILTGPIGVRGDTVLSYWLRPENKLGGYTCVDLVFSDGSTLRDSSSHTASGTPARAAGGLAKEGEWVHIEVPLGSEHAGKVIDQVMLAYDSRSGGGAFGVLLDDLSIVSEATPSAEVKVDRAVARPTLTAPAGWQIAYTTDGTNPTDASPRGTSVALTPAPGRLNEVRWRLVLPDGRLAAATRALVW
ncbi:MAG: hypothetical protein HZB16_23595 [Armatimonadetes bacterium]|nr:hypothetical protein [Armatimonadota bacterium]